MIMGNRKDLTNWQSNWRPSNGAAFLLAVAFLSQLGRLTAQQQQQPRVEQSDEQQRQLQQQTFSGERSAGNDRRAFAAPLDKRQQQGNSVLLNGEPKPFFKIHYRDGVQKAIFDETPRRVPPDFEDNNVGRGREFDAYEDDRLVDPRNEAQLWIPFIYRNESEEVVESTPAPLRTTRPLVAPEVLQSRQPVIVRTTTQQSPFGRPPQPAIRPAQPFGRPPPPAPGQPPFQPRPPPQPQFPPQQQRPPPQQGFLPQQFRPATPQQPFSNQQPFQPQQPPPPPPQLTRPQQPPPPVAPPQQPQQSFSNAANIRTGVCRNTIFYTPQPVTAFDVQRIYTHFAMVVSVDQCARTCHEFNCDVAILDPRTRHCQFNPSTAFRLVPSCPRWPNPLFRNNFQLGEELVKIQCVTCQQRRRGNRPAGAQQLPANLPPAGLGQQQQSFNLRRPSQPQFVLRTTTRERIGNADLNGNGLNASPIQRVANAAKTKKFAADGSTAFSTDEEPAPRVQAERDLSEEFHKLERLLKSAEDYLDQPGGSGQKGRGLKSGREVPSWREGHPQGDGFSPLKINPLRQPYFSDHIRPTPIFYSTDSLRQRRPEDEDISPSVSKRRSQRQTTDGLSSAESSPPPEADSSAIPAAGGAKPKLNSAGSVKLQTQQPDGLRELPEEKAK